MDKVKNVLILLLLGMAAMQMMMGVALSQTNYDYDASGNRVARWVQIMKIGVDHNGTKIAVILN